MESNTHGHKDVIKLDWLWCRMRFTARSVCNLVSGISRSC